MVLTGTDALAAGMQGGLWETLLPAHAASLPDLSKILLPGAAKMQDLAQNQGVIVAFCPAGPLLEYMPDKVKIRAEDRRRPARLVAAEQEQVHVCAPGEFRPRPRLPDGHAVHPRRQGPAGPEERLGQDLDLSRARSARTSNITRPAPAR